jgi:HEAT repeat protein
MAKNVVAKVIGLLEHERVELRAAAAMVLAEVGADEPDIEKGLVGRLADADAGVRRIALEGLAASGATGIAPKLVPLLRGDDEALATRAAQLLAGQGAAAEAALRKELASDAPLAARRVMAQLLIARGTTPALEAVLGQIAGGDFAEQALQLLRGELDGAGGGKLADAVEKLALAQLAEAGRALQKAWKAASKAAEASIAEAKAAAKGKGKGKVPAAAPAAPAIQDPLRDADVAAGVLEVGNLLRLIGYLARPSNLGLLLDFLDGERPRPVRLSAIAGLRRVVAKSEAKGTERAVETLIELCDGDDVVVAQAAVDTLRGARIPEKLAKPFAALAKSKNAAAQKLAMERLPAGGGAAAVKALVDALAGSDIAARDAATRGLAKAPEAVLPVVRALVAMSASAPGGIDEGLARRYAGVVRAHKGNVSSAATGELVETVRGYMEAYFKGKASADTMVHERVIAELIADVAPAAHVELLFDRARRLRKSGKPVEAFGSLKPLLRSHADLDAAIDDDQRYLMAVLAVEAHGEALIRAARGDDPVLAQFTRLAERGYPVAKKLAKEQGVSDEAIYGLGFRLMETKDASNMELGAELLQGIIDERPRSKLAKSAKNKLKLSGYGDED